MLNHHDDHWIPEYRVILEDHSDPVADVHD